MTREELMQFMPLNLALTVLVVAICWCGAKGNASMAVLVVLLGLMVATLAVLLGGWVRFIRIRWPAPGVRR